MSKQNQWSLISRAGYNSFNGFTFKIAICVTFYKHITFTHPISERRQLILISVSNTLNIQILVACVNLQRKHTNKGINIVPETVKSNKHQWGPTGTEQIISNNYRVKPEFSWFC